MDIHMHKDEFRTSSHTTWRWIQQSCILLSFGFYDSLSLLSRLIIIISSSSPPPPPPAPPHHHRFTYWSESHGEREKQLFLTCCSWPASAHSACQCRALGSEAGSVCLLCWWQEADFLSLTTASHGQHPWEAEVGWNSGGKQVFWRGHRMVSIISAQPAATSKNMLCCFPTGPDVCCPEGLSYTALLCLCSAVAAFYHIPYCYQDNSCMGQQW